MDRDEDYFGKIEAYFVERRGSPLFITPAEWFLVSKWEEQGIPLHVVEEGIDRVFERPRTSTKPRKLGYCRQAVESAFRRFREVSLGGGHASAPAEERFDPRAHLHRLAEGLRERVPEIAARVDAIVDLASDLGATEDALAALDEELFELAERGLDPADRDRLLADASQSLASYRDRMPDKVYQSALKSAYRRRVRRHARLPRLSLYDQ